MLIFDFAILFYIEKRKFFWIKFVGLGLLGGVVCFVVEQFSSVPILFILPLAIDILLLWLCYKVDLFQASLMAILGYALQNMTFCFTSIITSIFDTRGVSDDPLIIAYIKGQWVDWLLYLAFVIASYFIYAKRMKLTAFFKIKNIKLDAVSLVLLFVVYFINMQWADNENIKSNTIFRIVMILYISVSIFIILGFATQEELIKENEVIKELLHKEEKLQKLSEETIDTINRKCHDLKHVVGILRAGGKVDEENLEEVETALNTYNCFTRTGNSDLDAVLAEKYLRCMNDKITLSCLIDGKSLSFMSSADIYSLFGNLLDNAIEFLEKHQDVEERQIKASGQIRNKFIVLGIENYCNVKQTFENGMPTTTKNDKTNHGWGVKSIAYIVKKYGGTVVFSQQNNIFSVSIMIPLR